MIQLSSSEIAVVFSLVLLVLDVDIYSQSSFGMVIITLFMHSNILSSSSGGSNEVVSK